MTHSILIADPDPAFGQMLEQLLTANGDYTASAVTSGALALAAIQEAPPDLAIVDLSLHDVAPLALIGAMRRVCPTLHVMLIPLGDTLPSEYAALGVQGVLTKPFFIGDLGETIARALGTDTRQLVDLPPAPVPAGNDSASKPRVRQEIKPVASPPREEPPAAPSPRMATASPAAADATAENRTDAPPLASPPTPSPAAPRPRVRQAPPSPARRARTSDPIERPSGRAEPVPSAGTGGSVERALASLSSEVRAELVLLMREGTSIAQQGSALNARDDEMMALLRQWTDTANRLAVLVGEARGRFKQLHLEGERYHLYGSEIGPGTLLFVVCRADIPFGTLRLAVKSVGPAIARLLPQ